MKQVFVTPQKSPRGPLTFVPKLGSCKVAPTFSVVEANVFPIDEPVAASLSPVLFQTSAMLASFIISAAVLPQFDKVPEKSENVYAMCVSRSF